MSKFKALGENQNCRLNEAVGLLAIRQQLRLPALGISVNSNDGSFIDQPDFAANGITDNEPLCFVVRTTPAFAPNEEQAVAIPGQFVNAAMELHSLRTAADMEQAISHMIAVGRPGITFAEVQGIINGLPGVGSARKAAVKKWARSMSEPIPDPGPQG
jgi:hypothetical protein